MKPVFKYNVMMRSSRRIIYNYVLDAESIWEAQQMAQTLHPDKRILRITPAFESG